MFKINKFKEEIKAWLEYNPESTKQEFLSYCKGLIPIEVFDKNAWLLEQADMWFENIRLNNKKKKNAKPNRLLS